MKRTIAHGTPDERERQQHDVGRPAKRLRVDGADDGRDGSHDAAAAPSDGLGKDCCLQLPPEIALAIAGAIADPRDLAAWVIATGERAPRETWIGAVAFVVSDATREPARLVRLVPPEILSAACKRTRPKVVDAWSRCDVLATTTPDVVDWICRALPCADRSTDDASPPHRRRKVPPPWDAVIDAVKKSQPPAAAVMVKHLARQGFHPNPTSFARLLKNALRTGDARSFARMHKHKPPGVCPCDHHMGRLLFPADDVDTLAAATAVCAYVMEPSTTTIQQAVEARAAKILRWLLDEVDHAPEWTSAVQNIGVHVLDTALANDDAASIESIRDAGTWARTDDALLIGAGRAGALGVLAWAAGETRAAGPLPAWPSAAPAYGAAHCEDLARSAATFAWLLARPDAVRVITPGVMRILIENGHTADVAAVHDAGAALIDRRRACEAALAAGDCPHMLRVLMDRGARCGAGAWAVALERGRVKSLAYLKERCGTAHVPEALDRLMPARRLYQYDPVRWVRDNAPEVCARSAVLAVGARRLAEARPGASDLRCRCPRCAPPPADNQP
ncbi:hypothetical protein pdul_cds_79 [Pandoravirus dulcis]|uniref:Ankyrin repeat domain containing protein n=1 Tax=Pandoravirus dulcis TaxID=1349409 RepID=S4VP04_9VIRU|nr:hypothetical protein pdul_cds_79 [Pandoravirus dulcis]AGO81972.1 hypothetical protein pdul_cds_79 [Pandoravirus dulcis]